MKMPEDDTPDYTFTTCTEATGYCNQWVIDSSSVQDSDCTVALVVGIPADRSDYDNHYGPTFPNPPVIPQIQLPTIFPGPFNIGGFAMPNAHYDVATAETVDGSFGHTTNVLTDENGLYQATISPNISSNAQSVFFKMVVTNY